MEFIADFHIHSKYSRATSRNMDVKNLSAWAKLKGITLMGTGDFTHHLWLEELKNNLQDCGNGLFIHDGVYFILTAEISSIYSKKSKTYRIHNLIFAPSFKTVDKINDKLGRIGNLASDGRPILGLDAAELARIVFDIDENCMIVPAHCLLPGTLVHTSGGLKPIETISSKDNVYTHNLNFKKVTESLKREFNGNILHIQPFYFREGIKATQEHPFYVIKTSKNCLSRGSFCKPECGQIKIKGCKRKLFKKYKPAWVQAKDLEIGDCLIFPRFNNKIVNKKFLRISETIKQAVIFKGCQIAQRGNRTTFVNNSIRINKDFCRLAGYFVSEGYTNSRDCISFCFLETEGDYISDVIGLMKKIFAINISRIRNVPHSNGVELIFYSKVLCSLFSKLFYASNVRKKADTKSLPDWMLYLSPEKQVEIVRSWWYGDKGYTVSRILMNQFKTIFLRLGVIPSVGRDSIVAHKTRGKHFIDTREVLARHDLFHFSNLTFFKDKFSLLKDECFKKFKAKSSGRHGWIDKNYVYLPIRNLKEEEYRGFVYNLEVEHDNSYVCEFATVHNCWTPWFSLFGSMSGFDRIEDCFEEQTPKIFALETGLSCYDEKTEVLTENGWKRFSQVQASDRVCTLNIKSERVEFQKPTKIFAYRYTGKMYKLKTKRVDLLVTPNHKLLYSPCDFRNRKPLVLKEAQLLFKKSKIFKKDGIWIGATPEVFVLPAAEIKHGSRYYSGVRVEKEKSVPIEAWLRFFGFWIAEGWTNKGKDGDYNVCVCNTDQKLLDEIEFTLNSFGYKTFRTDKIVRVRDCQLYSYLKQFGKCYDKFIPLEIKSLSKGLLEIFLQYYIKGDGHVYGRGGKGLSATTTSVRLRDDLQEIALKVGFSAYYKLGYKKGRQFISPGCKRIYKQRNDSWIIFFIRHNRHTVIPSTIKKYKYIERWEKYNGRVFCVSVPNQIVYVRRNGIPVWCGNSDPAMNWRVSALDKFTLISNSDAHSPQKIGREANVFNCELDYKTIREVLKTKDKSRFLYTIEFFPGEGKYHFDGHRLCGIRWSPQETKTNSGKCPKCGKQVTVGVVNRVEKLSDRPEGFQPENAIPFKSFIPLDEIIADAKGVGKGSVGVERDYHSCLAKFGTEFDILMRASKEDLIKGLPPKVAAGVLRVRAGKVNIKAGFDGEYGTISIFGEDDSTPKSEQQLSMF